MGCRAPRHCGRSGKRTKYAVATASAATNRTRIGDLCDAKTSLTRWLNAEPATEQKVRYYTHTTCAAHAFACRVSGVNGATKIVAPASIAIDAPRRTSEGRRLPPLRRNRRRTAAIGRNDPKCQRQHRHMLQPSLPAVRLYLERKHPSLQRPTRCLRWCVEALDCCIGHPRATSRAT